MQLSQRGGRSSSSVQVRLLYIEGRRESMNGQYSSIVQRLVHWIPNPEMLVRFQLELPDEWSIEWRSGGTQTLRCRFISLLSIAIGNKLRIYSVNKEPCICCLLPPVDHSIAPIYFLSFYYAQRIIHNRYFTCSYGT